MNLIVLLLLAQGVPDPEEARRAFRVGEGLEVTLFASEPMIAKPIQMNFDAAGRLWVATSASYPHIRVGDKVDDKIVILEDKDGDGRADSSRVFADGLLMPTGLEPGHGGAYVANSIEILHLADTNGDGKADARRVVLSGFGTEDTHHIMHTFRWGPEGHLYFNQSIYIHSHVETPYGPRRLGGGGIWRFRPQDQQLEVFVRGMCNPWGHAFDRWGQSFGTDGAGGDGIHYLVPGFTFPHFPGGGKAFPGLNPGHPKYCGLEVVDGRHLPDDWQGTLVTNDFRANRVCRFALSEDGAGFSSKLMPDLLKSTDKSFRPIDVKIGPDGAIYVADWTNPIINHGEVDFFDPRRDRTHGRIWRVTAKGRPLVPWPKLEKASVPQLLEALKAPESWTRHFAKRLLSERDPKEVLAALNAWEEKEQDERHLLEALWVREAIGAGDWKLTERLLRANDPRIRAAATRLLGPNSHDAIAPQVYDDHPRVRLEAVRTLALSREPWAMPLAALALDKPMDRFLDHALWLTANELKPTWLPAHEAGKISFAKPAHAEWAMKAVKVPVDPKKLPERVAAGYMSEKAREEALEQLVAFGGPDEMAKLLQGRYDPPLLAKVLAAIGRAARERGVRPNAGLARIGQLLESADAPVRAEAVRLAGILRIESLKPNLAKLAEAGDLVAIEALASIDVKAAAAVARPGAVAAILARQGGAEALAAAFAAKPPSADDAKLMIRAMYAAGRQEAALVEILNKAAGIGRREYSPESIQRIAALVAEKGDPARGEAVFRRKELSCFQCHAIGGAGGNVGPDLSTLGTASPVEYAVESILFPDRKSKEGFVSMLVQTKSGEVVSGVRVRRNNKELVLRDATRDEIVIPAGQVEREKETGSIMPSGLVDLLTEAELVDLVRFLSELGKVGYSVGTAPVVRRWRVSRDGTTFEPAYSRVSGDLPVEPGIKFAQFDLDVTTPGKARLRGTEINLARGLSTHTLDAGGGTLRVEVEEAPGSPARFRIVNGK